MTISDWRGPLRHCDRGPAGNFRWRTRRKTEYRRCTATQRLVDSSPYRCEYVYTYVHVLTLGSSAGGNHPRRSNHTSYILIMANCFLQWILEQHACCDLRILSRAPLYTPIVTNLSGQGLLRLVGHRMKSRPGHPKHKPPPSLACATHLNRRGW